MALMHTRPAAEPDDVAARLPGALEEAIRTRDVAAAFDRAERLRREARSPFAVLDETG